MPNMSQTTPNFMGDGFIWWIGVVENRLDPLNLGRCQVRIYGWHHPDLGQIASDALPWAQPIKPLTGPGALTGPNPPKEGDTVFGFFLDGKNGQFPMILGLLPGIIEQIPVYSQGFSDQRSQLELDLAPRPPLTRTYNTDGTGVELTEGTASLNPQSIDLPTTSQVALGNSAGSLIESILNERDMDVPTAIPGVTWDEVESLYAPQAPFDSVIVSESGHLFEIDDTPGAERILRAHRAGTFEEWHPTGDRVLKVVRNGYEITMGNKNVDIMGICQVTIRGDASLSIEGDYNMAVGGDYALSVGGSRETVIQGDDTKVLIGSELNTISGSYKLLPALGASIVTPATITMGAITITATTGTFEIIGELNVTGTVTTDEDFINGLEETLGTHIHSKVQTGTVFSGPAVPGT